MNDEYRNRIIRGNVLDVLKELPDKLVDCVITSPPYWSLRDYKIEPVVWDGVDGCEHEWNTIIKPATSGGKDGSNLEGGKATQNQTATKSSHNSQFCTHCNAWRGQLGLEPTIELYIDHLLQIFDEVGRVMKDEATLWVNLGDSYSGGPQRNEGFNERWHGKQYLGNKQAETDRERPTRPDTDIPTKSLCLIPQRFAIAMVDRGWILRNTIIWHKPSCMPSSAKDRFTVDFEYVYFFVKQQKYWFEQQFEPHQSSEESIKRAEYGRYALSKNAKANKREGCPDFLQKPENNYGSLRGRNKRCVWTVNTQPFPEAHFATFPEKLVEPMILAGCPEGGIVLDPFIGSGTVAIVSVQNRRDYLGIDLSSEYNEMSNQRIFDPKNSQINLL